MKFSKPQITLAAKFLVLISLVTLSGCQVEPAIPPHDKLPPDLQGTICFQDQVLPIFQTNCAFSGCHGSGYSSGGIDLSTYDGIRAHVNTRKPGRSELYRAMLGLGETSMPPAGYPRVGDKDMLTFYLWISQGAQNNSCVAPCDTTDFSYSGKVSQLVHERCESCHGGPYAIRLNSYTSLSNFAQQGTLGNVLRGINGPQMPPTGPIPECEIRVFEKWIAAGSPNN